MRWAGIGLVLVTTMVTAAAAADPPADTIDLSKAWTPATTQAGGDAPIYLTITNRGNAPDSLVRTRCPMERADFTVKHATDRGEGGTTMREMNVLTIPAGGTATLAPGGDHLMLLGVRQPLHEGDTFTCTLVFKTAGTLSVGVKVAAGNATTAP